MLMIKALSTFSWEVDGQGFFDYNCFVLRV